MKHGICSFGQKLWPCWTALLMVAVAGCGMGEERQVVVAIDPAVVDLTLMQPQVFTARVSGIGDTAVDWSISGGTVLSSTSSSLQFRAPSEPGEVRVRAVCRSEPTAEGFAKVQVSVPTGVTVGIDPLLAQVPPLGELTWVASVAGTYMPAVDWSTDGGAFLSQDDGGARWMAPSKPGSYRVVATSRANRAVSATATVNVVSTSGTAPLVLWVTPADVEMAIGERVSFLLGFSTNETPGIDVSVSWAATGGTIDVGNGGVMTYTTASKGRQLVIARSNSYPDVAASANVLVRE